MEVNNPTKQMTQGLQPQVQAQQHGPKAQQSGTGQQPLVQQKSGIKQLDKAQPPSRRSPKGPQKSGERQVGGPPPTQQQAPARATVTFTGPGCTYATTPGHDHLQQIKIHTHTCPALAQLTQPKPWDQEEEDKEDVI